MDLKSLKDLNYFSKSGQISTKFRQISPKFRPNFPTFRPNYPEISVKFLQISAKFTQISAKNHRNSPKNSILKMLLKRCWGRNDNWIGVCFLREGANQGCDFSQGLECRSARSCVGPWVVCNEDPAVPCTFISFYDH